MPFPIDVSKPFRYPSELKRLVQAVRVAGDYDETRWVEWKRALDLTATEGTRHIVRQILGFANRDPQVAAQWAGGYAYLLIGACPEALMGITPIDPEQLVSKTRPYVGSHITWTPEYVEVDDVTVLVIIVEPPRLGDEIHALRKQLDTYKPGTVLVRRHGQIDQADVDELAMLQRRLLARTPEVELTVEPVLPVIEGMPDFQSFVGTWATGERERRMSARHKRELSEEPASNLSLLGVAFAAAAVASRDPRSLQQYEAEIDSYLAKAKQALLERGIWYLAQHSPAKLTMQVRNSSARNYTQVAVILSIESAEVRGYGGGALKMIENDKPHLPKPPDPLGTPPPSFTDSWALGLMPHVSPGPRLLASNFAALSRVWRVSNIDEGVSIEFDPCDLRPYGSIHLPAVPLIVNARPGTTIPVKWRATATNADGIVTGRCAITASESTLGDEWRA
jgi:hypothetical protein